MKMADKFVGKWRSDPKTYKNYEAFAKASGIASDLIEKFKQEVSEVTYKFDGNSWTVTHHPTSYMPKPMTYPGIQLGKQFEGKDFMGKGFKLTMNLKQDGTLEETTESEMAGWKKVHNIRKVTGDKMTHTITLVDDNVTMSHEWTKCD